MKKLLKILNPLIAILNFFRYTAHLETYKKAKKYKPYDFSKDISYF